MLRKSSRAWLTAAVLVTVVSAAAGCGSSGSAEVSGPKAGEPLVLDGETVASADLLSAARDEGKVTVYSAVSEEPEIALLKAFRKATGIDTELVRVPTNEMMERVQTEFGAKKIAADVLRMPDISFIRKLADQGVFQAYKVAAWDAIDDSYKQPDGRYYSWTLGPTAFAVNTEVVDEKDRPTSYQDLLDPSLKDKIGFAGMDVGTTAWVIGMFERTTYGVDYWKDLAEQDPVLAPGNAQVADQVGRGEIGVGVTRPNVILAQKDQGAPVEMVWPSDGVPVFPFYLGMVSGAKHTKAAEVFMNWSMSKAGQQAAGDLTGEYPVRDDVTTPKMLGTQFPELAELKPYNADEDLWVDNRESWTAEWNKIFGVRQ
jgi:iron(III) transport system substrate-binding protein